MLTLSESENISQLSLFPMEQVLLDAYTVVRRGLTLPVELISTSIKTHNHSKRTERKNDNINSNGTQVLY